MVWIDILASDDEVQARRAQGLLDDPRVTHFHDPDQHVGRAFAEVLDVQDVAWDVYLLYAAGPGWDDHIPAPRAWFHQLGGGKADETLYRSGHGLVVSLHAAAGAAGFPLSAMPPDSSAFEAARGQAMERLQTSSGADDRCATCRAAGQVSTCSLGGWTRLLARNEGGGMLIVSGSEPMSAAGGRREVRLRLAGLNCAECMLRAATGPITLDGVDEVEVLLGAGELRVLYGRMSHVDVDRLVQAVRAHGFGVELLSDGTASAGATSAEP